MRHATVALLLAAASLLAGCGRGENMRTRVMVTGESDVRAQPDTAVVVVGVVTQSGRAVEAQQVNARKSEAVIAAVRQAAGEGVEVRTSDYSLSPQYDYGGGRPRINGYEARNTVTVTMRQLDNVGAVIDAATQAGANNVEGVSFVLRESNPARRQTLAEATKQAMEKAETMAQALGGRVVRVVEQQEGGFRNRPTQVEQEERAGYANMNTTGISARQSPRTPVETGPLNVRSEVQLVVEIETGH
ncbi:MAG TPA: SIMPL domain-containing protein [Pyrinomonadaceae bacterium]|nr:SIMPL domain-containing protein [Pyrinomonadaceae bacterium]